MTSGSDNGYDKDKTDADKVIRFPSLAQRDQLRREKTAEEERIRAAYKKRQKQESQAQKVPFFNTGNLPVVTRSLALVFIAIHVVLSFFVDRETVMHMIAMFGFVPGYYTGAVPWHWSAFFGPFSYAFLHGGWMHIGFNSVMLLALGVFFERMLGGRALLFFFFLCSFGGALFYMILEPFSGTPVIGASGGVTGLFAAMLVVFHDRGIYNPLTARLAKYGVLPMLGFWLAIMVLMGLAFGDVAWQAHVGGFLTGAGLIFLIKRGKIKF